MRTACTVSALVVALLIAGPAGAAGTKKDSSKATGVPYFQTIDRNLSPVTLTSDQSAKLEAIKKEYEPKLKEIYAKRDVLTPDQKKAGDDAKKAAKEAGKTKQEVKDAVTAAIKETDDQKKQEKAAGKELHALEKEIRGKIAELLTAEQKAQIDAAKGKKSDKPAKAAKAAGTSESK